MAIADMLSQNIVVGSLVLTCRSLKILLSHTASHAALVAATYSASADDSATVACFLEDHETVLDPS